MSMTVKTEWYGQKVKAAERKGAAKGLLLGAEHILEQATRIVPLAPSGGTLQASGVADVDKESLTASVSYDTVYAVRQHEELTYRHAPGRQAKYLETPVNRERDKVKELIAREIKRDLG